jgi:hypothetical protein
LGGLHYGPIQTHKQTTHLKYINWWGCHLMILSSKEGKVRYCKLYECCIKKRFFLNFFLIPIHVQLSIDNLKGREGSFALELEGIGFRVC